MWEKMIMLAIEEECAWAPLWNHISACLYAV
jgi:hypothetical protein